MKNAVETIQLSSSKLRSALLTPLAFLRRLHNPNDCVLSEAKRQNFSRLNGSDIYVV